MNTIHFLLAIHNHQPVGNFDFVLEDAYQRSYAPFLGVLRKFPAIKVALHHSGCLIDWLETHHPEHFERVDELVLRGQVEPLTGGYYEPILPAIPEADRVGQILKLSDWLEARFGKRPSGAWLAERVWEPGLVDPLARAGVRYTMVDDAHFIGAGIEEDRLWGPYITEDQGVPLHVFPISKELRYLIPFRPPEETIEFLRKLADAEPGRTALLGDDGEKFGVWPKTHALVYEEGWLDRFFTLLEENQDWIHLSFPSEVLDAGPPMGKVYLPTASYEEMMEWSLPAESQKRFHLVKERLDGDGAARFVRGGFWRNFFARYPESDHLNKRVIRVGKEAEGLSEKDPKTFTQARERLWAAECNCAYWHGVFGGLYLPHLRNALYENLLEAEQLVDRARHPESAWTEAERSDFDCDGDREVILKNPDLTLVLAPGEGGALQEISVKPLRLALGNGLTRRVEAYHERVGAARPEDAAEEGSKSIHDLVLAKEEGLERHLHYDSYRRASLQEHFLRSDTTIEAFHAGSFGEQGDFLVGPYEAALAVDKGDRVCSLRRTGVVWHGGVAHRLRLEKRIRLAPAGAAFGIAHVVENAAKEAVDLWFGVEWNLSMLAGDSPDHRYRIPGVPQQESALASSGEVLENERVALFDRHRGFEVGLSWSRPARLWRCPVETVSLSEAGFERIYQSSSLLPTWSFRLEPGERFEVSTRFEVKAL